MKSSDSALVVDLTGKQEALLIRIIAVHFYNLQHGNEEVKKTFMSSLDKFKKRPKDEDKPKLNSLKKGITGTANGFKEVCRKVVEYEWFENDDTRRLLLEYSSLPEWEQLEKKKRLIIGLIHEYISIAHGESYGLLINKVKDLKYPNVPNPDNRKTSKKANVPNPDNRKTSENPNVKSPDNGSTSNYHDISNPDNGATSEYHDILNPDNGAKSEYHNIILNPDNGAKSKCCIILNPDNGETSEYHDISNPDNGETLKHSTGKHVNIENEKLTYPNEIDGLLEELRKIRNQIVHRRTNHSFKNPMERTLYFENFEKFVRFCIQENNWLCLPDQEVYMFYITVHMYVRINSYNVSFHIINSIIYIILMKYKC